LFHAAVLHRQQSVLPGRPRCCDHRRSSGDTLHLIDVIGRRIPSFAEITRDRDAANRKSRFRFYSRQLGIADPIAQIAAPSELYVHGPFSVCGGFFSASR
jgi:hypothetical protein